MSLSRLVIEILFVLELASPFPQRIGPIPPAAISSLMIRVIRSRSTFYRRNPFLLWELTSVAGKSRYLLSSSSQSRTAGNFLIVLGIGLISMTHLRMGGRGTTNFVARFQILTETHKINTYHLVAGLRACETTA